MRCDLGAFYVQGTLHKAHKYFDFASTLGRTCVHVPSIDESTMAHLCGETLSNFVLVVDGARKKALGGRYLCGIVWYRRENASSETSGIP